MDWSSVKREHVELAIKKFIEEKPNYPEPRSYYLIYNNKKLPSKYIRGLAHEIATGEPLNLNGFNGGEDTVNFFKKFGYEVKQITNEFNNYDVADAVWLATAIMTAEKYYSNSNVTRDEIFFKQSDIVSKSQTLAKSDVHQARVSMWVNGDNSQSTYKYLRADHISDPSLRRLSMIDEFSEKTYPTGIDSDDLFEINGHQYNFVELLDFVKNVYPGVMKKMQPIDIDYKAILDYLDHNQEIPYSDPEAPNLTIEEKNSLLTITEKAQKAMREISKIANRCNNIFGLDKCLPGSWLDGTNKKTRRYLWTQMKYKIYEKSPVSVSIFVEKNDEKPRYRISLEMKEDGADDQILENYHSHLDVPRKEGMVYVAGSNKWGNPEVISESFEEIKNKIKNKEFRKVQLSIYVESSPEKTNEQYDKEIMAAVQKIIPYYEHVVGSNKRAWLITWNPDKWHWTDYDVWCSDTKKGISHRHGWRCSTKQPVKGDDVYLIKTGKNPRGIIGHGTVVRESYKSEYYDPLKSDHVVKDDYIEVEFDRLQNYKNELILKQEKLKVDFSEQCWSPQNSGIAIKTQFLPALKKMWNDCISRGTSEVEYWPSLDEYNPKIDKDEWYSLLNDSEVTTLNNLKMFKMMLELGGESTCANLAEKFGGNASSYNGLGRTFAEKVYRKKRCELYIYDDREYYFTIPFVGRYVHENGKSRYSWKIRPELKEALEEMDLSNIDTSFEDQSIEFDKNVILYGPPGTGKTYSTAIYAVAICDELEIEDVKDWDYSDVMIRYRELLASGRIEFTTFHQSYGYEEFIEGIKPIIERNSSHQNDCNDDKNGEIKYDVIDGVFKAFCERAHTSTVTTKSKEGLISDLSRVWKVTIRNEALHDCFDNDRVRINWGVESDGAASFVDDIQKGDIIITTDGSRSEINGIAVVATDDAEDLSENTDSTSRQVVWLAKSIRANIKSINKNKILHRKTVARVPNMAAADIISLAKKLNPDNDMLSQTTVEENNKPYVFVIDEINRGNISKIFGELITLIEDTKRDGMEEQASAVLPYSGDKFSVPSNVYILGTMNTADRSIALMDTALRRRFQFIEMMPDTGLLRELVPQNEAVLEGLDIATMLERINERITFLYDREHTIGHAFFTKLVEHPNIETLKSIFEKSVIPLLQEYFYEDYQKIQLVLGDNAKTDPKYKFINDEKVEAKEIFKGKANDLTDVIDLPEKKYSINKEAFFEIESYKQII